MAEIKITCKCGNTITVKVKTIDALREQVKYLQSEIASLKRQLKDRNEVDALRGLFGMDK
jgi:Tfp pilus assembly protein PilO